MLVSCYTLLLVYSTSKRYKSMTMSTVCCGCGVWHMVSNMGSKKSLVCRGVVVDAKFPRQHRGMGVKPRKPMPKSNQWQVESLRQGL